MRLTKGPVCCEECVLPGEKGGWHFGSQVGLDWWGGGSVLKILAATLNPDPESPTSLQSGTWNSRLNENLHAVEIYCVCS